MIISDTAARALQAATVTKGRNKGLLLAKPPISQTLAYAAWQAAVMACNPFKASIWGQMMMTAEQRAVYDELLHIFDTLKIRNLDRDRNALERLGAW
jgi:hypothetical protein